MRLSLIGWFCLASIIASCSASERARFGSIAPGAHYVAMGSSFAAGPGVFPPGAGPPRCGRSAQNYAQQLAQRLDLRLNDVSCSGAKTSHILSRWDELPAQLDAVQPNTRLVTLTIGGNDVGYVGGLLSASCRYVAQRSGEDGASCLSVEAPKDGDFQRVKAKLGAIIDGIFLRAPEAQVVFVDYAAILAPSDICSATPLRKHDAQKSRVIARELHAITAAAAAEKGAGLISASLLTKEHHACAKVPWMQGYTADADWRTRVPYHPTIEAMTAIADALEAALEKPL